MKIVLETIGEYLKEKTEKKIGFSEEYENFVRNIFDNKESKEDFLAFLKAEYIDDKRKAVEFIRQYENEDFVRLFLSFEEVSSQLRYDAKGNVSCRTMASIFATEIGYVLDKAHVRKTIEEDSISPHCGLTLMFEQRISPVSADGKILTYVGEGENGGFSVDELGDTRGVSYEVKKNGFDIFDDEGDIISEKDTGETKTKLEFLERVLKHHNDIDSIELSEDEEHDYYNMGLMFQGGKKGVSEKEIDIRFGRYLLGRIEELRLKLMRESKVISIESGEPYIGDDLSNGAHTKVPQGFKLHTIPQKAEAVK